MAPHERPRHAPAPRLRGAGTGTLVRPAGTLPADVRRGQLDRRELHHARQLLPHPAAAASPLLPQAAGHDDPEIAAQHKLAVSKLDELATGVQLPPLPLDDAQQGNSDLKLKADKNIKRVVICSGKVYFDLLEARDEQGLDDVYLLRLEQFYPFRRKAWWPS